MAWGLRLVIIGALVGAASGALPTPWGLIPGILGAAMGITGGWLQHKAARAYDRDFSAADWTASGADWELSIPASEHGKGRSASATVEMRSASDRYAKVTCGEEKSSAGDVIITISARPFDGRIAIH